MRHFKYGVSLLVLMLYCSALAQDSLVNNQAFKTYQERGVVVKSFDFDGLENYLKPEADTIYIVNFWATWCKPCIEELPYFEQINKEFKSQKVKVLLVSLDMAKQVASRLIPFLEKNKITAEVVLLHDLDADVWINKVDKSWSGALPATLIYNTEKKIFFEQSFTYTTLLEQLTPFLKS